jgi:hypothetical protein
LTAASALTCTLATSRRRAKQTPLIALAARRPRGGSVPATRETLR